MDFVEGDTVSWALANMSNYSLWWLNKQCFFWDVRLTQRLSQSRYPDIGCVELIRVTGSDAGRKMTDEEWIGGKSLREHLWRSDRGEEGVCVFVTQRERNSLCVCVCVSRWWQNKRPPLSCVALRILRGFRAPSARGGEEGGGALWPSLELPVCLFPHCRPPNRGVLRLSHGSGPSQPPASFDLADRRRESEWAFGALSSVCDGVADRRGGGDGWGSRGVKG